MTFGALGVGFGALGAIFSPVGLVILGVVAADSRCCLSHLPQLGANFRFL